MAKITLVSRNFPPLSGGMERLVHQLYLGLTKNHDVRLLGPAGCEAYAASGSEVRATRVSPTPVFLLVTFFKGLYSRITGGASDIVIGGSGLVGPVVVVLAKLSGARSVLLLHGLDIIADSRIYQMMFVPFLRMADAAICNSRNTARLATKYGVPKERITIINPGVELPQTTVSREDSKQRLDCAGQKVLLSVGRLMPRKGLAEFIANSLPQVIAADSAWLLLIAGAEPDNALNRPRESVLESIQGVIAKHDLQEQVRLFGHANDEDLAILYAAADVFVFPLIEMQGDVEGFGMVAVEAAAYGTPTVAFDCGGVADAVMDGASGALIAAGDYERFSDAILEVAAADLRQSSFEFAQKFSWLHYNRQIEECLNKVVH